ncbi:MAG: FAD-dependent oxidoreductase [Aquimonas sp.]|nr:FAD-dependent oxidoreductase [Aquimonas sp.]
MTATTASARDEVLILGGGVIGLCSALYLLEAGRPVRLLERSRIGAGASRGNCGTLTPSHAPPLAAPGVIAKGLRWMLTPDAPLYVRPRLDPALWSWLLHFAARCNPRDWRASTAARAVLLKRSRALLAEAVQRHGLDCGHSDSGLLYVFRTPKLFDSVAAELPALLEFGVRSELLDGAAVAREEPALKPGMAGGILFPDDGHLRPDRYLQALADRIRTLGGVIEEGVEVQRLEIAQGRLQAVHTSAGVERPREAVLALGAWSPAFARSLGLRLPIQPGKGYSITYSRPALAPRRPMVLKERSVCVTTWADGFRLGSTMEFSGYDARLNRVRLDALARGAAEFMHEPGGAEKQEEWFGWRPMTWDDLPLIGRVPRADNLVLAAGHGMMGMSMSAVSGHLVADLICGRQPVVDPAPLNPARFG